jgi:hypothetical protein
MEPYGVGIGAAVVLMVVSAVFLAVVVSVIAHAFIRRYWLACAVVTALVLLGCIRFHVAEGYRDALSIVMLYGIGATSGLAVAALVGLPIRLIRDARGRSSARRLADRWDARERRSR